MTTDMKSRSASAQYVASLPRRKVPAGCGQQRRHDEREWRMQFEDTVQISSEARAERQIERDGCAPSATRLGVVLIIVTGVPALIALGHVLAWAWNAVTN